MRDPKHLSLVHRIEQLERCMKTAEQILQVDLETGEKKNQKPAPKPDQTKTPQTDKIG